jgi:PAS domain S-box-containing protein
MNEAEIKLNLARLRINRRHNTRGNTMEQKVASFQVERESLTFLIWGIVAGWTALVAVLGWVVVLNERRQIEERARSIAPATFQWDHHWVTLYGRVYVSVTRDQEDSLRASTPPAGFATTTDGERLALMSPLAVREIFMDESEMPLRIRSRLTSLHPVRPDYAPDSWESDALRSFEAGQNEQTSVEKIDDDKYIRYIRALHAEPRCLRCHTGPEDKPGAVLGALSVAVPLEPIWSFSRGHTTIGLLTLAALWVVGVGGIAFGNSRITHLMRERARVIEERVRSEVDRERIESALQDSEQRNRRIVTTSPAGIWESDEQGRTIFVNKAMADMLGYAVDEIAGKSIYDFVDEPSRAAAREIFRSGHGNGVEQREFLLRTRDGSSLWTIMAVSPILDHTGSFRGTLTMVTDIGERKIMEEALRRSESLYRALFESNVAGVYRTSIDGTILDCNSALVRLLGWDSAEELKKRNAAEFYVDPADRRAFLSTLEREKTVRGYLLRLRRRNGEILTVLQNVAIEGTILQGTIMDVTGIQEIQNALRESEKRLRQEIMRSQIAADLHDEIGSNLSSISVFHEMLKHEIGTPSPNAQHLLRRIGENIQETQEALHHIVWMIDPENDSLDNILLTLQQYGADVLETRGIRFDFMVPKESLSVRFNMETRRQVYLVVKEALNNVVRHSQCTQAFLGAIVTGRTLTLTVRDNGRGFDVVRRRSGNGIKNMETRAASIGAVLAISSDERIGTTITLRIPIA